ncbi:MAG: PVC-type heme-binding CxxCH protein [Planctomycetaceae bacterium]
MCSTLPADEIQPATDRPQPKSPAESAKCVQLPPGFRLDIVAAEPLLRDPAAICFDERGRLFAGEIHGYNLDGYYDIIELNKTGKLDREVRRVRHASPENQARALKETYGTVKLLRDTDGDGVMDVADIWADRLPPCYGVIAARGGVIAICAPDIVFLADRDGDGEAEVRETLFTGFARELIERGMSNPRMGPDNWIYVAAGGGGGEITGPRLTEPVAIGQTDFRFKSDGSAIEPVTGRERMFGLTLDDFGDRFHTIVSHTIPLPYHYLARNPFVESPEGDVGIHPTRDLFPISEPDPWRKARAADPAWVKFYGSSETKPNGQFTASSGQVIYRADAFPEAYRGNYFVCDPANNLIHRCLLERDGVGYTARRPPEHETSEFLASTDQWFRPMNLGVGPDGAIYIVDFYREIIEDFSAIPRFLQQQYAESLIAGQDHGRIWRLSWQGDKTSASTPSPVKLDTASIAELVKLLDHPNHWWRDTAQRLLVERNDPAAFLPLAKFVRNGKTPQGRMQALYALDGHSLLKPADVQLALDDDSELVRVHALRLADRWLDQDTLLLGKVLALADDPQPRVRLQVALSLGESRQESALDALVKLAVEHGDDRWMTAAITSSIANSTDRFLTQLLATEAQSEPVQVLLGSVSETVGAQRDDTAVGRFLQTTSALAGPDASKRQLALLEGLARGLNRGMPRAVQSPEIVSGLEKLLANSSVDVSRQAVLIAGLLELSDSPAMQAAWKTAGQSALDGDLELQKRLDSVALLAVAPWRQQQPLGVLLDARQPTELQLAVVNALGHSGDKAVSETLLANWSGLVPKVQDAIIDAFFARQDRLPNLLDAVEQGIVPPVSMSALRREQLSEHSNELIRERARRLLAGKINDDRAEIFKRYASALTLPRDPARGEAVFTKTCTKCHKIGEKGFEIGPNLMAVRTRPDETLLVDVLDPSSTLSHGYTVYTVLTTDGRVHTGLLGGETATSITLRTAIEGTPKKGQSPVVEDTILRQDIDEMRALSKSLMPDGMEKEITPQNLADLIGYLRHSLGPVIAPGVVLFDDEPEFLDRLNEGGAKARLTGDDKHSGNAALELTDGQRHSRLIAGWEYPIVENASLVDAGETLKPSPRGFRYMRFAWKSTGAKGVMFELAASGSWPAADKPLRRYYSGENSSKWSATEISPDVPTEWTVVTVDLWKDFGEFTLTGIAPTAMGGSALFDKIELLQSLDDQPIRTPGK